LKLFSFFLIFQGDKSQKWELMIETMPIKIVKASYSAGTCRTVFPKTRKEDKTFIRDTRGWQSIIISNQTNCLTKTEER